MANSRTGRRVVVSSALLLFAAIILVTAITPTAKADPLVVTFYGGHDTVGAYGTEFGGAEQYSHNYWPSGTTPAPYSASVLATDLGSSASTMVSLTSSSLAYQFSDVRSYNNASSSTASNDGVVYFSVNQNTPYTFVGSYSSAGNAAPFLELSLEDSHLTYPSSISFSSDQDSPYNPATLSVGSSAYEVSYEPFAGSLTGELIANDKYQFLYSADINACSQLPSPDGGSATGDLTLYFGSASPVPEPSSLVAWAGLGAMGLIACAWRRRRAKA